MIRILEPISIVLLCATALAEDKPAEAPKPIEFIGRVEKIMLLSQYSGVVIRMDRDPRFVIVVSVQRATEKAALLPKEKEFAFAIHSKTENNGFRHNFAEGDICILSRDKVWKVRDEEPLKKSPDASK